MLRKCTASMAKSRAKTYAVVRFTVSYMDMNRFYQDSSSYRLSSLPINSRQADFSPNVLQGRVSICIGPRRIRRNKAGGSTGTRTPFLDLYFHADTNQLRTAAPEVARATNTAQVGGSAPAEQAAETNASPDKGVTKAEIFSRTLNTKYHEGPMTFTRDQTTIVFTRNNASKGKSGKSSDGVRKLKTIHCERKKRQVDVGQGSTVQQQ